jgi:hypothetical protein
VPEGATAEFCTRGYRRRHLQQEDRDQLQLKKKKSRAKFLKFFSQHTFGLENRPLLNRDIFFFIPSSTIWNESEPITKKILFPPVQNTYGTHMI